MSVGVEAMTATPSAGPTRRRTFLETVGGPNSVSLPGYFMTLALAFISNLATAGIGSLLARPLLVVPVVVGQSVTFGFLGLARRTWLRQASVRPLPARTLISFGVAALFGGMGSGLAAVSLRLTDGNASGATASPAEATTALLASFIAAVLTLAVSAGIVDAWRTYRSNALVLTELRARIQAAQTVSAAEADAAVDSVRADLAATITSRLTDLYGPADAARATSALIELVDDVVRPASRELFKAAGRGAAPPPPRRRLGFRALLTDLTLPPLLVTWPVAVVVGLLVLLATLFNADAATALQTAAATMAFSLAVTSGTNAVYRRVVTQLDLGARVAVLVGSLLALAGSTLLTLNLLVSGSVTDSRQLALAVMVALIALAFSGVKLASAARDRQTDELEVLQERADWEEARARLLHWERHGALAEALHGPVQSALLAASLRLELAHEHDSLTLALAEARSIVQAAVDGFAAGVGRRSDVLATLEMTQRTWAPVCDISWELDSMAGARLELDSVATRAAAAVITEACSNAIRHVKAGSVHIVISTDGQQQLFAEITDGGSTPAPEGAPGGGTTLLDAVSLHWQRVRHGDGSSLTVVIPIA